MRAAAIILAAGSARRFGAAKQLALLDGRPLLQHVIDATVAVPALGDVVVVLGARADAVAAGVVPGRARIARSEHWAEGMAASLQTGLAALAGGVDAVLVVLGDQPRIVPAVLERILARVEHLGDGFVAARATYGGRPGHPVALGPGLLAQIPALRGDAGARDLLATCGPALVEVGDLGDGTDVDTPEELEAMAR